MYADGGHMRGSWAAVSWVLGCGVVEMHDITSLQEELWGLLVRPVFIDNR